MEIHDSFSYFIELMDDGLCQNKYNISDIYLNKERKLVFSITERAGVGDYNDFHKYPETLPFDKELVMEAGYVTGPDGINNVKAIYEDQKKLAEAIEAHDKQVADLIKNGTGAVGFMLGGSPLKTAIETMYDVYDVIQDGGDVDTYNEYFGEYAFSGDAKDNYGVASKTVLETYKVLSDDSIEKAKKGISDFITTKYTGSVGTCSLMYSDEDTASINHVILHANSVAPEYVDSFNDISTKSTMDDKHGISAVGKWDNEFKKEVIAQLDKLEYNGNLAGKKDQIIAECTQIIDGGYDVSTMRNPEKNGLVDKEFEKIQDAYNAALCEAEHDEKLKAHIPVNGQADSKNCINSLWGQQGTGSGGWLDEEKHEENQTN